jgi:DNA-directed RNA polymerase specialized sigma24 family protein
MKRKPLRFDEAAATEALAMQDMDALARQVMILVDILVDDYLAKPHAVRLDRGDCCDACIERAWMAAQKFRPERGSMYNLLHTTIDNTLHNLEKQERRRLLAMERFMSGTGGRYA